MGEQREPCFRAGHEFKGDDGTVVATLVCDVYPLDPVSASQFRLPDGSTPDPCTKMPLAVERAIWRSDND